MSVAVAVLRVILLLLLLLLEVVVVEVRVVVVVVVVVVEVIVVVVIPPFSSSPPININYSCFTFNVYFPVFRLFSHPKMISTNRQTADVVNPTSSM